MRNSVLLVVLLLSGVSASAPAKTKKIPKVSPLFCQARYAYVETADGEAFNPAVLSNDRDAATALQQHLREWNRYTMVSRPEEADLVWVVNTGREVDAGINSASPTGSSRATAGAGPGMSSRPGSPGPAPGANPSLGTNGEDPGDSAAGPGAPGAPGAEVGDRNDLLVVYQGAAEGTPQHTWLWRKSESGGLMHAGMPLFQQIRDAVDTQCAKSARSD